MPNNEAYHDSHVQKKGPRKQYFHANACKALDEAWQYHVQDLPIPYKELRAKYQVPRSSLQRWVKEKIKNYNDVKNPGPQPMLTAAGEQLFAAEIGARAFTARPMSQVEVRRECATIANKLGVERKGNPKMASQTWLYSFMRRTDSLVFNKAKPLERERGQVTKEDLAHFCDLYHKTLVEKKIKLVVNMDEWGINGELKRQVKTAKPKDHHAHEDILASLPSEHITFISAIASDGTSMRPIVVMKGKSVNIQTMHDCPEWLFSATTKGWSNAEIFAEWWKLFLAHQEKKPERKPVLLLFDQHHSHFLNSIPNDAAKHDVHVLTFPAHATHIIQPLDVGVIGTTKAAIQAAIRDWKASHRASDALKIKDVPAVIYQAVQKKFNKENIQAAFAHAGLMAFNRPKILNHPKLGASLALAPEPVPDPEPLEVEVEAPEEPDAGTKAHVAHARCI